MQLRSGRQSLGSTQTSRLSAVQLSRRAVVPRGRPSRLKQCCVAAPPGEAAGGGAAPLRAEDDPELEVKSEKEVPRHWMDHQSSLTLGERRALQRYYPIVARINALEPVMLQLSNAELRALTGAFKARLSAGEALTSLLPEAFAAAREAAARVVGMRPYDVQLVGGVALAEGLVAEMKTGEGKTLVAVLPAYLYALTGRGVHVVTVNDYLAQRDAQWIGKVFEFMGLSVGVVTGETAQGPERGRAFDADVTYVTAYELAFTFLADNLTPRPENIALRRPFHYAVVDEVDSILIDECRNPFIVNVPDPTSTSAPAWRAAVEVAKQLEPPPLVTVAEWQEGEPLQEPLPFDFVRDAPMKSAKLTQRGMRSAVRLLAEAGQLVLAVDSAPERAGQLNAVLLSPTAGGEVEVTARPALGKGPAGVTGRGSSSSCAPEGGEEGERREVVGARGDVGAALSRMGLVKVPIALATEAELQAAAPAVLWAGGTRAWGRFINQAVRAVHMYKRNVDYLLREGQVVIVDPATGRERVRSRWQLGLHQAIEAKEGVRIAGEDFDQARVTYQALFNYYPVGQLAGMTGTAATEAEEFSEAYGLQLVRVPPHRPSQRIDHPPTMYFSESVWRQKLTELVREAVGLGRPVLLGSASVEQSEQVYDIVAGISLEAELDPREAEQLGAALEGMPRNLPPVDVDLVDGDGGQQAATAAALRDYEWLRREYGRVVRLLARVARERRMAPDQAGDVEMAPIILRQAVDMQLMWPQQMAEARRALALVNRILDKSKLANRSPLNLLNADPTRARKEAEIIAQAGLPGTVTIATAMAGRGTDILLGGNPKGLTLMTLQWMLLPLMAAKAGDLADCRPAAAPLSARTTAFASKAAMQDKLPPLLFSAYAAAEAAAAGGELGGEGSGQYARSADAVKRLSASLEATDVERSKFLLHLKRQPDGSAAGMATDATLAAADEWVTRQRSTAGSAWAELSAGETALRRYILLQWVWFTRQCEGYAVQLRSQGGLLVAISSLLHDSRRVELQLRGRTGRQGDPGETRLLSHHADPAVRDMLMPSQAADLWRFVEDSGAGDEPLPNMLVQPVVQRLTRTAEQFQEQARNTTRRYDAVIDAYRQHVYRLRRALVAGGDAVRGSLAHEYLHDLAASLVVHYIDASVPPARWRLEDLMAAVHAVINIPSGGDGGSKAEAPPAGGANVTVLALGGQGGAFLFGLIDVAQDVAALREALRRNEPLAPAVVPGSWEEGTPTLPIRRRAATVAARQRGSEVRGRPRGGYSSQALRLQEWLGNLLVAAYERKRSLIHGTFHRMRCASLNAIQVAVALRVWERDTLLNCLDALWADFLQDVSTLQRAAQLRSFSSLEPLDEFRLESAEMFSRLLRDYRRQAAVAVLGPVDCAGLQEGAELVAGQEQPGAGAAGQGPEEGEIVWAQEWVEAAPAVKLPEPGSAAAAEGNGSGGAEGLPVHHGSAAAGAAKSAAAVEVEQRRSGHAAGEAGGVAGAIPTGSSASSDADSTLLALLLAAVTQAPAGRVGQAVAEVDERWRRQQREGQ